MSTFELPLGTLDPNVQSLGRHVRLATDFPDAGTEGNVLVSQGPDTPAQWLPQGTAPPNAHVLATTTGLGAQHTTSGLTAGQVLRATGASTAAFQRLTAADIDPGTFPTGNYTFGGTTTFQGQIASTVLTGTAPLTIASTTVVTNLNADLLDGLHESAFGLLGVGRTWTALQTFNAGITVSGGTLVVGADPPFNPSALIRSSRAVVGLADMMVLTNTNTPTSRTGFFVQVNSDSPLVKIIASGDVSAPMEFYSGNTRFLRGNTDGSVVVGITDPGGTEVVRAPSARFGDGIALVAFGQAIHATPLKILQTTDGPWTAIFQNSLDTGDWRLFAASGGTLTVGRSGTARGMQFRPTGTVLFGQGTEPSIGGIVLSGGGTAIPFVGRTSNWAAIWEHDTADRQFRIDNTTNDVRFHHGTAATVAAQIGLRIDGINSLTTVPWDFTIGSLGRFDSTDTPTDQQLLVYHAGGVNKWQAENIQFVRGSGDFKAALLSDNTAIAYVLLDPGTNALTGAVNAPDTPVVTVGHKAFSLEIPGSYVKTSQFRYFEWEVCTGTGCTVGTVLATTTSRALVHSRLTTGEIKRYRVRAINRNAAQGHSAFSTPTGDNTVVAQSDTQAFAGIIAGEIATVDLTALAGDIGILITGQMRGSGNTYGINFGGVGGIPSTWTKGINFENTALPSGMTGTSGVFVNFDSGASGTFLHHGKLDLNFDGSAIFKGQVDIIDAQITAGGSGPFHLVLRDPDVAHGMTDVVNTDIFGAIRGHSSIEGGLFLLGLTEAVDAAISMQAITTGNGGPAFVFQGRKKSTTTSVAMSGTDILARIWNGADAALDVTAGGKAYLGNPRRAVGTVIGRVTTDAGTGAATVETTLHSITVPAGVMGTNGGLRIVSYLTITGFNGAKTVRIKFGGQLVAEADILAANSGEQMMVAYIFNRGATGSQINVDIGFRGATFEEGVNAVSGSTTTVDTTAAQSVTVTGETANANDEITAKLTVVELLPD